MPTLPELYQEVILDHNRRPRHYGRLPAPTHTAQGHNPLCGDRLSMTLRIADGRLAEVAFEGAGCAIAKASASLLTDALLGHTTDEALTLIEAFHAALTTPPEQPIDEDRLGKLAALVGVRVFPVRIKCASLAPHTLRAAITGTQEASTE